MEFARTTPALVAAQRNRTFCAVPVVSTSGKVTVIVLLLGTAGVPVSGFAGEPPPTVSRKAAMPLVGVSTPQRTRCEVLAVLASSMLTLTRYLSALPEGRLRMATSVRVEESVRPLGAVT